MTIPSRNPFRAECIDNLEYQGADWHEVERRLERFKVSVVFGKHGCGKTTFLQSLSRRLESSGRAVRLIFINDDDERTEEALRDLTRPGNCELLIIDGAEQLSFIRRLVLLWRLRKSWRIVLTAHKRPFLPVLWECSAAREIYSQLLLRLTRSSPGDDALSLLDDTGGNMREAFRRLYDLHAQR